MGLTTSWKEEGIQIGLQQGLRQGRREEGLGIVPRQLERRFGKSSQRDFKRIHALSVDQLEVLGDELLDFQRKADLTAWLDAVGK